MKTRIVQINPTGKGNLIAECTDCNESKMVFGTDQLARDYALRLIQHSCKCKDKSEVRYVERYSDEVW